MLKREGEPIRLMAAPQGVPHRHVWSADGDWCVRCGVSRQRIEDAGPVWGGRCPPPPPPVVGEINALRRIGNRWRKVRDACAAGVPLRPLDPRDRHHRPMLNPTNVERARWKLEDKLNEVQMVVGMPLDDLTEENIEAAFDGFLRDKRALLSVKPTSMVLSAPVAAHPDLVRLAHRYLDGTEGWHLMLEEVRAKIEAPGFLA